MQGKVLFRFKNIINGKIKEIIVNGIINKNKAQVVETVPGWGHEIINIGNEKAIGLIWANEKFNIDKPDTYKFKIK